MARPKGSKVWDEFSDRSVWVAVKSVMQLEKCKISDACRKVAYRGFSINKNNGKNIISWSGNHDHQDPIRDKHFNLKRAYWIHQNNNHPVETIRQRFYVAERLRRVNKEFKDECDFWLKVKKRIYELRNQGYAKEEAILIAFRDT